MDATEDRIAKQEPTDEAQPAQQPEAAPERGGAQALQADNSVNMALAMLQALNEPLAKDMKKQAAALAKMVEGLTSMTKVLTKMTETQAAAAAGAGRAEAKRQEPAKAAVPQAEAAKTFASILKDREFARPAVTGAHPALPNAAAPGAAAKRGRSGGQRSRRAKRP
jgi:hypothetical protein